MHSKLFLHETADSRQKCLIHKTSQFPSIIQLQEKQVSHLCLLRFSLLSLPRQVAAPETEEPEHGGDQTSLDTYAKMEDAQAFLPKLSGHP